jgi:Fe-S cluster assembly iron-binding protein IscA
MNILKKNDKKYIRFGVTGGGCSGYNYLWDVIDDLEAEDITFYPKEDQSTIADYIESAQDTITDEFIMVIDEYSLPVVTGSRIDLGKELMGVKLIVENPNSNGECGCGESFTIKS